MLPHGCSCAAVRVFMCCRAGDLCFHTGDLCFRAGVHVLPHGTTDCAGKPWSNVVRSLCWYFLHYLFTEVQNRSSEQVKGLLMFLFYDTYDFRGKKTPIIHAIRKSVVSGRHRFTMVKHQVTCDIFAKALDDHPSWEEFLDDRGSGTPPPEFFAMIEKVNRQVAMDDNVSLGSKTLASRESWVDPSLEWKKREVSCVGTGVSCYRAGAHVLPYGCFVLPYGCLCASVRVFMCCRTGVYVLPYGCFVLSYCSCTSLSCEDVKKRAATNPGTNIIGQTTCRGQSWPKRFTLATSLRKKPLGIFCPIPRGGTTLKRPPPPHPSPDTPAAQV